MEAMVGSGGGEAWLGGRGDVLGQLLRKAAQGEWNQPKGKRCAAVSKAERNWALEITLTSDVERQSLEFV